MRFDDRLNTVLNGDPDSPRGRAVLWQQLVDLLAQDGDALDPSVAERALRMLALLSPVVPVATQRAHASAVGAQAQFAPLIVFLANRDASMAGAVLLSARLADADWAAVAPAIGPVGRSVLRRRADLGPMANASLRLFASGDLALPSPVEPETPAITPPTDISDLVRRIEEYRQRHEAATARPAAPGEQSFSDRFDFVTDTAGRIIEIENAPRGRFVGADLSQPARATEAGCDAGTARRVGKRNPVVGGRLLITGNDAWSGIWICDAEPRFSTSDGRFVGYLGTLRRPSPDEQPVETAASTLEDGGFSADMVRMLMHELRSPLNVIGGFAQMIDGQYAGPVSGQYRTAAQAIMAEADQLLAAVDEVDLLARHVAAPQDSAADDTPFAQLVEAQVAAIRAPRTNAGLAFAVTASPSARLIQTRMPHGEAERLIALLLQPLRRHAEGAPARQIGITHAADRHALRLIIDSDEDMAGTAGLGFAFEAATALAHRHGGDITVSDRQLILNLPALEPQIAVGERAS